MCAGNTVWKDKVRPEQAQSSRGTPEALQETPENCSREEQGPLWGPGLHLPVVLVS